jgi:hypothetical protein
MANSIEPVCCELCSWPFVHLHRINPGNWGGKYESGNVIELCPNHHVAIHFLMRWFHRGGKLKNEYEEEQLLYYLRDKALRLFWETEVKPVVIKRMQAEGRWHPYVRTLPAKKESETESA